MRITKLGHSCLHVEDGEAHILLDPGGFSTGFENLTGLTAVLITHQHPDHLDPARLPTVLQRNPDAKIYADPGSAEQLQAAGIEVTAVHADDELDVGTPVSVHGRDHAVIHRDIPTIPNAGYLVGGRLLHPGDSLFVPKVPVEILALPAAAPWMALKETIDYQRAVAATTAFGIHNATVAPVALPMYYGRFRDMGPAGARWLDLDSGEPVDL